MARRASVIVGGLAMLAATMLAAKAADVDVRGTAPADLEGVACDGPAAKTFESVWLGHFSGGYSHYVGEGGPIVLDWRDEKLCFPTLTTCRHHIADMRRDFHRPEGYFTCLPVR